jgi:hypothetical protein
VGLSGRAIGSGLRRQDGKKIAKMPCKNELISSAKHLDSETKVVVGFFTPR